MFARLACAYFIAPVPAAIAFPGVFPMAIVAAKCLVIDYVPVLVFNVL